MSERLTSGPRILLTGATGYLGHAISRVAERRGLSCLTAGRSGVEAARSAEVALDLSGSHDAISAAVREAAPDVVLHAAALSSMGACAEDEAQAMAVNGDAVRAVAAGCPRLLQVSTDLVFDGREAPYTPRSTTRPLSVYGRSKLRGERLALEAGNACVARLPLLYGPSFDGRRGASDMLQPERPLRLFVNEFRTPLSVSTAAERLLDLAVGLAGGAAVGRVEHLAGAQRMSRWDFARRWAAAHGVDGSAWSPAVCTDPQRPRDVSMLTT